MDENQPTPQTTAEWLAANPEVVASLRAEGAAAERQRIADVRARSLPGHEALIERLAADGKTSGVEAGDAVLAAEKAGLASVAQARQSDGAPNVPYAPAPDGSHEAKPGKAFAFSGVFGPGVDEDAIHTSALAYQAEHPGASYQDAIRAITTQGGN
jgi:hypothetical protein